MSDVFSVETEETVLKLFSYFGIYTVLTEQFSDFVGIPYSSFLSHSKTIWLSLTNAIERILHLYGAPMLYFSSEEKDLKIRVEFWNNALNEF